MCALFFLQVENIKWDKVVDSLIFGSVNGDMTVAVSADDMNADRVLVIGEQLGGTSEVSGGVWAHNKPGAK